MLLLEVSDKIRHLDLANCWLIAAAVSIVACLTVPMRRATAYTVLAVCALWTAANALWCASWFMEEHSIAKSFVVEQGLGYFLGVAAAGATPTLLVIRLMWMLRMKRRGSG